MSKNIKEKSNHCCICTSTKDLQPYLGTKWRCKVCEKDGRQTVPKK